MIATSATSHVETGVTSATFDRWLKSKKKRFGVYIGALVATASNLVAGIEPIRKHFPSAVVQAITRYPLVVPVVINTVAIVAVAIFVRRIPRVDEVRLKRASTAIRQLHVWWRCAWVCWALFYLAQAVRLFAEIGGVSASLPRWATTWDICLHLVDNIQTAFLVCCFFVLAKPTAASTGEQDDKTSPFELLMIGIILLAAVEVVVHLGTTAPSALVAPSLLMDLFSGTTIALIVGRLDSKFVGLPYSVVSLLYLYAVFQAADIVADISPEGGAWVRTALYAIAVPAKMAMFVVFYWLFHSGRGLYYLYSVTEVSSKLTRSWSLFDATLKDESAPFVDRFWYQPALTETTEYDVFISAPMAAHGDAFKRCNDAVKKIAEQLRLHKLKVFYAGDGITERNEFDVSVESLRKDLIALRNSRRFMLIYPKRLASSVLVEAGIALANNTPSIYFAARKTLPFLLRAADMLDKSNVRIEEVSNYDEVINLVSTYGLKLFPESSSLGGMRTVA
jgi:hypothetical protein